MSDVADYSGTFGSGLSFGGGQPAAGPGGVGADVTPAPGAPTQIAPNMQEPEATRSPDAAPSFGSSFRGMLPGPHYRAPDPATTALDQTADTLQQRIQRANTVATDPILQFFNPEGVASARDFVPKATEALQKIRQQKADMQANAVQAQTLGIVGEVADEASAADRMEVAKAKALKGDLRTFKGIQAVDAKTAESIQDQVHEAVAGHLTKAQLAFDSLAGMQNQGQYEAKLSQLRKDGTLTDLEALGLKVPAGFDQFNAAKAREGQALREARIGVDTIRQKLEERNTYQPMVEKEAQTYHGRLTTAYGDQITNGTWSRNGAAGTRGLVVNGAADPRDLGKSFTLASPDQRKAIKEEFDGAVPKQDVEKYRAFNRTYDMAVKDAKGNPMPDGKVNTNPNVQQGVSEGLASMLRGGSGGANVGLLKIELAKRGWAQGAIDGLISNYAGAVNTMFANADKPYMSANTQKQIRDVMDVLKTYNDSNVADRASAIAARAGALGLDPASLGFGKSESAGAIGEAMEAGRRAQIERMMPNHQAIGGGDGVLQLGAQRPGTGATGQPAGTAPTTQLPGAQPLQTPVQQATMPPGAIPGPTTLPAAISPPSPGGTPAPAVTPPGATGGGAPTGNAPTGTAPVGAPAPLTIAGQPVNVPLPPGASPNFVPALQRIESGKSKDPWTATVGKGADGKPLSSASGAYQMLDSTWNANKPAGAPNRAADATPAQQSQAFATLVAKNAQSLTAAGLPVNDTSLYVAHNLGATGAGKLLTADPSADARTVIGDRAASNNPMFFRGKPTVATVLQRYENEMNKEPPKLPPSSDGEPKNPPSGVEPKNPLPGSGQGLMDRVRGWLSAGAAPEGSPNPSDASLTPQQRAEATRTAASAAPAAMSTAGAVAGSIAGPAGTVAGGAAGGGAGQVLKDYLQGREQSPAAIAKETALGGVLGVGGAARPFLGAAVRAVGAGAVEAGATAAEGGSGPDIVDAGLKGASFAAGSEAFGRALGMVGHKVFSMFAPDAQKAVQSAAAKFAEAEATLAKETPTLPGIGGAAGGKNPKYEAAEKARTEAEIVLKDAGLKPEEAAYAHQVSSEGVPKQEAEVARPAALEKERVGAGYQQLENEVGAVGVGAPKATPKLPDGPRAAVENKQVSAKHAELAERVEAAVTAPAPNWQAKWVQLKDARSALLEAERDALTSTSPGRSQTAKDMRTLADTVRTQQEKAAKHVFGEKDGEAFVARLRVLDTRYRNLMEATNGGDIAKAAAMKGEAGREAERKFVAFAHDDPQAVAAYRAMRKGGSNVENDVRTLVGMEKVPYIGHVVTWAKMAGRMREWAQERAAGSPAKFADLVRTPGFFESNKPIRDLLGTATQRGAVMQ